MTIFPTIIRTEYQQRHGMSHKQPKDATTNLHGQELPRQLIFSHRASPHQPEIDDRQIGRRDYSIRLRIHRHLEKAQLFHGEENRRQKLAGWSLWRPGCYTRLKKAGPSIELWESMSWTRNQFKKLRCAVYEVDDLRDEEQQ